MIMTWSACGCFFFVHGARGTRGSGCGARGIPVRDVDLVAAPDRTLDRPVARHGMDVLHELTVTI